jgi:hypothetical protein
MRKTILILTLLFPLWATAQSSRADLLKQLNSDVWYPFLKGVNENNSGLYNSVHADEFYWVLAGTRTRIMNFKEYVADADKVMSQRAAKGITTELNVRFMERNVNEEFASEKCVIQWISGEPDAKPTISFGIVQVFSRKINGAWKKIVQYVHTESVPEETFNTAFSIEKTD